MKRPAAKQLAAKQLAAKTVATTLFGSAAMLAMPAMAQDVGEATGNERIMMVTIPAGEECPEADDADTIIVCDTLDPNDQYRIPRGLRQSGDPENQSWAERSRDLEDIGNFGPLSCSNVGLGSELGCTQEMIEEAYAEKDAAPENRFSLQIEEARRDRLSNIDGEAARTQARVEELERAYMERLEAERAAPLPGEGEALPDIDAADPSAAE